MAVEESTNNASPARTSWFNLLCPCMSCTRDCGCLRPFQTHTESREPKPNDWFRVENGQLCSGPKATRKKRRKRSKSAAGTERKREETDMASNAIINNSADIVNKDITESDESKKWRKTKIDDKEKHLGSVSDLLKHLVLAAKDLSSQSSEAPSCDDETPPLLRSVGDPYQPNVVMEIAGSPQTEWEI